MKINTVNARNKLKVRSEPYWLSLATGRAIGFRKTASAETWQGKYNANGKRSKQSLGSVSTMTYEQALSACNAWFKEMDITGGINSKPTVNDAVDRYLVYLKENSTEPNYKRAHSSITKHITNNLGGIELTKVTALVITDWLSSMLVHDKGAEKLRKSKDSANRNLTNLKAILNMSFKLGMVTSNIEWLKVDKFKAVAKARDVFLSKEQLALLVECCEGDCFRSLVQMGILTGARLGELVNAKCSDFDAQQQCLTVSGKTGTRQVYLSPNGFKLCSELCAGREDGWLLVSDTGNQWGEREHTHKMERVVKKAKLPEGSCFYSLRHAYISHALMSGINVHLLAKNCGNSPTIIEKNYAKFLPSDIKNAFTGVEL